MMVRYFFVNLVPDSHRQTQKFMNKCCELGSQAKAEVDWGSKLARHLI